MALLIQLNHFTGLSWVLLIGISNKTLEIIPELVVHPCCMVETKNMAKYCQSFLLQLIVMMQITNLTFIMPTVMYLNSVESMKAPLCLCCFLQRFVGHIFCDQQWKKSSFDDVVNCFNNMF